VIVLIFLCPVVAIGLQQNNAAVIDVDINISKIKFKSTTKQTQAKASMSAS